MGLNILLTIIAGITMTTMVAVQVAPSIVENAKVTKVQTQTINNQEVIFEAIKRYITIEQKAPIPVIPTDDPITVLIAEGYIDSKVNDNGFDGKYKLTIKNDKGIIEIETTITDEKAKEAFLKSFRGISKPTQNGNEFTTKYVIPSDLLKVIPTHINDIEISDIKPSNINTRYWYDTSGDKVVMKIKDENEWKELKIFEKELEEEESFKPATEYSACSASRMTWSQANSYCKNLKTDGGGWRLPTVGEVSYTTFNTSAGKIASNPIFSETWSSRINGVPPCNSSIYTWTTTPAKTGNGHWMWINNDTTSYLSGSGGDNNYEYVRCVR